MFQFFRRVTVAILLFAVFLAVSASAVGAEEADTKKETGPDLPKQVVFATVGDEEISILSYQFAFMAAIKDRFYHGKPPQGEVAALQREVGQEMVDRLLLVKEAKKRGIMPNAKVTSVKIARVEKANVGNSEWPPNRDRVLATYKNLFDAQSLVTALKKQVIENIPDPKESVVMEYYERRPELFTEPEKIRVHVILLKVNPGAPQFLWDDAKNKARKIISLLQKGGDFAELAREHSMDVTAKNGGDMGFVHKGTVASAIQMVVETLGPGEFSTIPVMLLEGPAIVKRGGMILSVLHKFEDVKDRAKRLLMRDLKTTTWEDLLAGLKKGVTVNVNEGIYLPLETGKEDK